MTASLESFTGFPHLPFELRTKIWRYSLPEPRVVPVQYNRRFEQYTSNTPQPALLHTSREARRMFLEKYNTLILSPKYPSTVYVNFETDTIYFYNLDCSPDGDLARDLASSPYADRILNIAFDSELWDVLRTFKFESTTEVGLLTNLKTIALVEPRGPDVKGPPIDWMPEGDWEEVDGVVRLPKVLNFTDSNLDISHLGLLFILLTDSLRDRKEFKWGNGTPDVSMWFT
ncbi:hypothetical protein BP6252_11801 [Coleophoma cylindrospora]|uniref:2EXR domain-containing protein n=1 Tax=Coleophoma cylindrospora TaxID=1849047 RepID=A0A3D8QKX4_9HELO|nr:hypothetical protein BP6252_11801 [Coleophoma cylindrospora]